MPEWSEFHDDLIRPVKEKAVRQRLQARRQGPSGRTAGIEWDGEAGELSTGPLDAPPDDSTWDELLRTMGEDPERVRIVPGTPIRHSAWEAQTPDGIQMLHSYRARIELRPDAANTLDFESLVARIQRHRPSKREAPAGPKAFVVCYGDMQFGKEGTEDTINRFLESLNTVPARLRELRRMGREIGSIHIPFLGDCIEHVRGSYASQPSTTELSLSEQVRVQKNLAWKVVEILAPLAKELYLYTLPGNHDQAVRDGGDQAGHASDSFVYDMAHYVDSLARMVPEVYGNVRVVVPERDSLVVTADMGGVIVAMAHGHQFQSGKDGYEKWWKGQAHGMLPAGEARLLLAGHKHHWASNNEGPKGFIQIPALDSGSQWYRDKTGMECPAGIVTFVATDSHPLGWDDLKIL